MPTQIYDRNDLIAMLRWQLEIGIDEALLDFPDASDSDYRDLINPDALTKIQGFVEPSLKEATPEDRFQFEREGYFCLDNVDSKPDALVFNRVVGLRDTWAKIEKLAMQDQENASPLK